VVVTTHWDVKQVESEDEAAQVEAELAQCNSFLRYLDSKKMSVKQLRSGNRPSYQLPGYVSPESLINELLGLESITAAVQSAQPVVEQGQLDSNPEATQLSPAAPIDPAAEAPPAGGQIVTNTANQISGPVGRPPSHMYTPSSEESPGSDATSIVSP